MKNKLKKINVLLTGCIPVIAAVVLVINSNSTTSFFNGQPKAPEGLKKYRKF